MFVDVYYKPKEQTFRHETDMTKGGIQDAVGTFLELYSLGEKDESLVTAHEEFHVRVWQPETGDELFKCETNCGNLTLRDGILMDFMMSLED